MVVFDPVEYTVSEDAGSQLYQLRLLGEIETQVVVTVTSEDGTAEGILVSYFIPHIILKILTCLNHCTFALTCTTGCIFMATSVSFMLMSH